MLGLKQTRELRRWDLGRNPRFGRIEIEPVEVEAIKVMSVGFLIAEQQMFAMPAMIASLVGRQLVDNVNWGDLDYLVIDLPPGTADLQQQIFTTMGLAGAIVVVGPQDAAHLDARKLLTLLRDAGVEVLGAVENMRGLTCPHCGEVLDVFPPVADDRSILQEVELLVSIPLDPAFARVNGIPPQFERLAAEVEERLGA
jgi:ATP-binding protein involved in chromosome partitioning